jgi:hypothetical protein
LNGCKEKMCEEIGALYLGLAGSDLRWKVTQNETAGGHIVAPAAFTFRFVLCGVSTLAARP